MKVVSVWNPKGGQGKSLIALNLAAAAVSELELKPLVICRDPQGTAMLSYAKGNLPFDVKPSYPKGAAKYDLVIADHVASDLGSAACTYSDHSNQACAYGLRDIP